MQLFGRLEETFRVELPLQLLFDGATVARLAAALVAREPEPGQMDKIARVLRRVRGMTAEERQALLAEKRRLQGVPR
jgi:hypothetical protein